MIKSIYDIAKEAGVSTATVSRVINKSGYVSKETREKVENIIKKYNFTPFNAARELVTKKTMNVVVLVKDVSNPFHASCVLEIEKNLFKNKYMTLLANTSDDFEKQKEYIKLLIQKGIDGLFFVGSDYESKEIFDFISSLNIDIPIIGINADIKNSINVLLDEKYGIKKALEYFKDSGYKKPFYVGDMNAINTRSSKNKLESFLENRDILFDKIEKEYILLRDLESDIEIKELLNYILENKIDVVQFETDKIAIKFKKYVNERKLNIPQDIGIMGFDNINAIKYMTEDVSTIDHKIKDLCGIGVKNFLRKINNKSYDEKTVVKPEIILRKTT